MNALIGHVKGWLIARHAANVTRANHSDAQFRCDTHHLRGCRACLGGRRRAGAQTTREQAVSATEPDLGTTSYAGGIRRAVWPEPLTDVLAQMPGTQLVIEAQCRALIAENERLTTEAERLKDLVCDREDIIIERDATIERVQSLIGDTAGPLWSVRGVCEANLQAALNRRAQ